MRISKKQRYPRYIAIDYDFGDHFVKFDLPKLNPFTWVRLRLAKTQLL
jgi:hypothetical protein